MSDEYPKPITPVHQKKIVTTKHICTRDICGDQSYRDAFMSNIAAELTKAIRMTDSGNCHMLVQYKNILSRDLNPDGSCGFFVFTDEFDLVDGEGGPFHFYTTNEAKDV